MVSAAEARLGSDRSSGTPDVLQPLPLRAGYVVLTQELGMEQRTRQEIERMIKQHVWPRAGRDGAEIAFIRPFESGRYNDNWHSAGMGIQVSLVDGSEILFAGAMIDDALGSRDYSPLIERARAHFATGGEGVDSRIGPGASAP
jgi:hypothetical protein